MKKNRLFVSVDMDDWYMCRWASGSSRSIRPSIDLLFQDFFDGKAPVSQFESATDWILQLFSELNFRSTFFFTGVMARALPHIVEKVSAAGHEIGCHNLHHIDYADESEDRFRKDLVESKQILEDISGQDVIGYRAPNSSIPAYMFRVLSESGFSYDSSVTPTRPLFGKFGQFQKAPLSPYFLDLERPDQEGETDLLELPWSVFPGFRTPAGSGIMHRIAGNIYNEIATRYCLSKGDTSYYFHPYELNEIDVPNLKIPFKGRIFLRNNGDRYRKNIQRFLLRRRDVLINGSDLYDIYKNHQPPNVLPHINNDEETNLLERGE